MLEHFHFIRPYWLIAIAPLLVLSLLLFISRPNFGIWEKVCDPNLLSGLLTASNGKPSRMPVLALMMLLLLVIIALAGPTWQRLPQPMFRSSLSTIIVMDLGESLYAKDVNPNRLIRAKFKLQDILKRKTDGQVGLVAFSGESYVVSPLTYDADTISNMIPELSPNIMPVHGENIADGLNRAMMLFNQSHLTRGQVLLITDSTPNEEAIAAAKALKEHGFKLSILGVGTLTGAPIPTSQGYMKDVQGNIILRKLPINALQNLARVADGRYATFTSDNDDIAYLLPEPQNKLSLQAENTRQKTNKWEDQGRHLLWFLLPFIGCVFRRGWFEQIVSVK